MAQLADASPAVFTPAAGSLTAAAATIFAANPLRRGVIVSNNSDTVMTLGVGETGTADVGIAIPAGTSIYLAGDHTPSALLSLFCAGSAKKYSAYQW
jgi:hypothetical protein